MKKLEIAIKGLEESERIELRTALGKDADVEIFDYFQKAAGLEEVVKILFTNFNALEWARDAVLWELFERIVFKMRDFISRKKPDTKRQWVALFQNVTIVIPDETDRMKDMLDQLPAIIEKLPTDKSITTLTFNMEKKTVEVKIMRF